MILFSHCLLFQKIYNKVNLLACWMSNQNTLNVTTNKTNVLLYSSFNEKSTTLQYSDPNTSVHKTQQQSTKVLNFEKFFFWNRIIIYLLAAVLFLSLVSFFFVIIVISIRCWQASTSILHKHAKIIKRYHIMLYYIYIYKKKQAYKNIYFFACCWSL